MTDDGKSPPLARVFAVWAGADVARWCALTGHPIRYSLKGDGTVGAVEIVNGAAYIYVDFGRRGTSKFHEGSFLANDLELLSMPPNVNLEEARRAYAERWAEIDRQRADAERRREQEEREQLQAEEARNARKRAVEARLKVVFDSDFLSADGVLDADPDAHLVRGNEYDELKIRFVQDWAARVLRQPLDSEQAAAVAGGGGDIQVVARAGSGKTRTLVTRAIFLQKHCRVSPHELLLLAFNKKAAEEMKSRLAQMLGEHVPHVMTFHALAHALVHPDEDLVFDDAGADTFGRSREVQEVIDEYVRSEQYRDRIRDLMLAHFREDWERIVDGRFQLTMDEFLAHRRALPRESLKGDYVKSFGEKVIANALFEHGVEYRYERNFRWNGVNYRPDFTIHMGSKGGVIVEYFGLEGDADYDQMSKQKRRFWAERDEWSFVEFSPGDLAKSGLDGFVQRLLQELIPIPRDRVVNSRAGRLSRTRSMRRGHAELVLGRQAFLIGAGLRRRSGSSSDGDLWIASRARWEPLSAAAESAI